LSECLWEDPPKSKRAAWLFVDDLQDDRARVALLNHELGLKDVMCPLGDVDDVAVRQANAEVELLAS